MWEKFNYLKHVATETKEDAIVFRFEFRKPLAFYKGPFFYKKSIQVDFANSFVQPAKRYFPTKNDLISQVYVAQFNPRTVRVRFVLGPEGQNVKDHFYLERKGRFLIARIEKNEPDILEELLKTVREQNETAVEAATPAPIPTSTLDRETSSKNILKSAWADERARPPATEAGNRVKRAPDSATERLQQPTEKKETFELLGLQEASVITPMDFRATGVKTFSMLAVILGLIFLLFYLFKKFVYKNGLLGGDAKLVKVLGTGMLAPRKNIALVEVAGEILVLGISNDQITLLSTIRDEEKIERIKSVRENGSSAKPWSPSWIKSGARRGDSDGSGHSGTEELISKYLTQQGSGKTSREQSIAGVKSLIRKNLGKIQTAL
ncbi:MAG: flagellar biosynthetic protein FliO [Nitrospinales bacterium]